MGGSFQFKVAKESGVITYDTTGFIAGTYDVPAMTITIKTTGQRVFVGVAGASNLSNYGDDTVTGNSHAKIKSTSVLIVVRTWAIDILRTTGVTTTTVFKFQGRYEADALEYFPVGGFYCIEKPAAGQHTYKVRLSLSLTEVVLTNAKLIVYEL